MTSAQVADANQVDLDNTYQISFTGPGTYDVIDTTTATTIVSGAAYVSGEPIRFASLEVRISDDTGTPATGDVFDVAITAAGVYQGDSGRQRVEIQNGTFVQQNMTGDEVFQGAGLAGGVDIFSVLNRINLAMRSNDRAAIDPLLDDLDRARSQLVSERLKAGTRSNLPADTRNRRVDIQFGLDVLRSNLEDIDLPAAITQLTQQQVAYEATLGAAARIAGISLLDFLK